jgi:hypothetical protein
MSAATARSQQASYEDYPERAAGHGVTLQLPAAPIDPRHSVTRRLCPFQLRWRIEKLMHQCYGLDGQRDSASMPLRSTSNTFGKAKAISSRDARFP